MAPFEQLSNPYQSQIDALTSLEEERRRLMLEKQKEALAKPKSDWRNVLAQAVLTLAPAALGAAIGGKEGGALGFQAGGAGADRFLQAVAEEQQRRQGLSALEAQTAEQEAQSAQKQRAELEKESRSRERSIELEDIKQGNRVDLEKERRNRPPNTVINNEGNYKLDNTTIDAMAGSADALQIIEEEILPELGILEGIDESVWEKALGQADQALGAGVTPRGEFAILAWNTAVRLARAMQGARLTDKDVDVEAKNLLGTVFTDKNKIRDYVNRTYRSVARSFDNRLTAYEIAKRDPDVLSGYRSRYGGYIERALGTPRRVGEEQAPAAVSIDDFSDDELLSLFKSK